MSWFHVNIFVINFVMETTIMLKNTCSSDTYWISPPQRTNYDILKIDRCDLSPYDLVFHMILTLSRDTAININCKMTCSSTKRHYTNAILLPNIPNGKAHTIYNKNHKNRYYVFMFLGLQTFAFYKWLIYCTLLIWCHKWEHWWLSVNIKAGHKRS